MTHPLTEEMMDKIHGDESGYSNPYDEDDMRGAADWQLEQVVKFLRNHEYLEAIAQQINVEEIIDDLKKAMRPTLEDN